MFRCYVVANRMLVSIVVLTMLFACVEEPAELGESVQEIVGGDPVEDIAEMPWQVSLQYRDGFHFCGGAILKQDWVLTAAHCVDKMSLDVFRVVAGIQTLSSSETLGQIRFPQRIVVFPGYRDAIREGKDIALIRLESPFILGGKVDTIDFATKEHGPIVQRTLVVASGWGYTATGGPISEDLQKVTLPVRSNVEIENLTGRLRGNDLIAAGGRGRMGTCNGDSGGPLTVELADGMDPLLIGASSFGPTNCEAPSLPDSFARISWFSPWIADHLNGMPRCLQYVANATNKPLRVPSRNSPQIESTITLPPLGLVDLIKLDINIEHPSRGDLEVVLISPAGTRAVLLVPSDNDSEDDFVISTIATDFQGESSAGDWRLRIRDVFPSQDDGILQSWSLTLRKRISRLPVTRKRTKYLSSKRPPDHYVEDPIHRYGYCAHPYGVE